METGQAWDDEPQSGMIGRSTGALKIPLLVKTTRSMGGAGILDASIVDIEEAKTGRSLYRHPGFKPRVEPDQTVEDAPVPAILGGKGP